MKTLMTCILSIPTVMSLLDVAWWSSVAQLNMNIMLSSSGSRPSCPQLEGLSKGQSHMCEIFQDHMPAVGAGAFNAIQECQFQFLNRRWNCSTPTNSPHFGPVHKKGTKEAAFTYSILSAGVAHEVGRRCKQGLLSSCGCSDDPRPKNIQEDWAWTGCGDNVQYGYKFARDFIDVREKEPDPKRSSGDGRALVNRRNNEAGRRLLKKNSKAKCKCHGVSGSCNLRTCWMQLPSMRNMGELLIKKYNTAKRVVINSRGRMQLTTTETERATRKTRAYPTDLVYLDDSPDYCRYDRDQGTLGTTGRSCSKHSGGADDCNTLCCGRGYNEQTLQVKTKCNCKFEWCCQVVCETCYNTTHLFTCK